MKKDLMAFLSNKVYLLIVGLAAVGAYGYVVTHYAVGMDDTAIGLYFEEGLAPYVGRWTLFFINRVLHINIGDFAPWMVELVSVLILVVSVTLWCALWKRLCEPKVKLPAWGYALVAAVFLSCPLISEVFVFYLHNGICTGYGVTALAVLCLLNSLQKGASRKRILLSGLWSSLLLSVSLGFYESFAIVYIMGAVMLFWLNRVLYGKAGSDSLYQEKLIPWAGRGMAIMLAALLERTVILAVLKAVYQLDGLSVYNVQYRKLFGEIFTRENELVMVLKRFVMKYYVNALTYLPITILVLALVGIGIATLYYTFRKKDGLLLLCMAAIVGLPVALSIVEGIDTRYRSAQYVPMVCGFAVLLLLTALYKGRDGENAGAAKSARVVRGICCGLLCIVVFNQCADMNQWFYLDDMKYQDMVKVMKQVAYDVETKCDTSKPVIFRGAYEVPLGYKEKAYTPFSSWRYGAICTLTDWVDVHLKEKYYAKDAPAYVSAEMPLVSTMQWGVTAFDGTSGQLIEFWKMHGVDGLHCETSLEKIEEAEKYRSEMDMPAYPQDGYIVECEEYIIINMSK